MLIYQAINSPSGGSTWLVYHGIKRVAIIDRQIGSKVFDVYIGEQPSKEGKRGPFGTLLRAKLFLDREEKNLC